jgi:hypothetical protein
VTDPEPGSPKRGRLAIALGLSLLGLLALGAWLDASTAWFDRAFDAVAHLFYEVPVVSALRRPTQLALARMHLCVVITLAAVGLIVSPRLDRHGRMFWAVFVLGYAIRALVWVTGSNLPLVPGDSCHYVEVATSIDRSEGPVKHYVESFFADYPPIRQGQGVLDDWATPLYASLLAGCYRLAGVVPGASLEATFAVAKGLSFVLNLITLPLLYLVARRAFGRDVALGAMALVATLPVLAIYAGFELRESLVGLTSVLAVGALIEVWSVRDRSRWAWAVGAGVLAGSAILARHTTLAILGAAGIYGLVAHRRRAVGPLLLWGVVLVATITPWGVATYRAYGEPFYTYTKYFQYTFSWTVHHYAQGAPRAADFYTVANAPEIARVKLKSLAIIAVYVPMILGLPVALGFGRRLFWPAPGGSPRSRDFDRLAAVLVLAFVAGTLANIADVTQVEQLGRYYLPLFLLMAPTAVVGLRDWGSLVNLSPTARPWLGLGLVALLWSDPTWAYDATWLVKPYQMHWPALRAAGDWIRDHPEAVPPGARVMTWFPWELRVASDRTTVLLPRSLVLSPYELKRIDDTIRQYGVTHVLWGSFEHPPHVDPEFYGPEIDRLRTLAGFTDRLEVYRSPKGLPYPVRLYQLKGTTR